MIGSWGSVGLSGAGSRTIRFWSGSIYSHSSSFIASVRSCSIRFLQLSVVFNLTACFLVSMANNRFASQDHVAIVRKIEDTDTQMGLLQVDTRVQRSNIGFLGFRRRIEPVNSFKFVHSNPGLITIGTNSH